jgi:hypothetical protein
MAEPLDELPGVVGHDELADDPTTLFLERPPEALDDAIALGLPTYDGVMVIPLLHLVHPRIGDVLLARSHRIRCPRAASFAKPPNT